MNRPGPTRRRVELGQPVTGLAEEPWVRVMQRQVATAIMGRAPWHREGRLRRCCRYRRFLTCSMGRMGGSAALSRPMGLETSSVHVAIGWAKEGAPIGISTAASGDGGERSPAMRLLRLPRLLGLLVRGPLPSRPRWVDPCPATLLMQNGCGEVWASRSRRPRSPQR